jgi:hypothetical protein
MRAKIQAGGVFDEQIHSGLTAGLARPLQMRLNDALKRGATAIKEAIGGLELVPLWKSPGQSAPGIVG